MKKISEQGQGRWLSAEKEKQGIYANEPPKLDYPKPVKNLNRLKILFVKIYLNLQLNVERSSEEPSKPYLSVLLYQIMRNVITFFLWKIICVRFIGVALVNKVK